MIRSLELHQKWLNNLRREGFKPTKYSKIYSVHFDNGQVHAIPSAYDFRAHLQKSDINENFSCRDDDDYDDWCFTATFVHMVG